MEENLEINPRSSGIVWTVSVIKKSDPLPIGIPNREVWFDCEREAIIYCLFKIAKQHSAADKYDFEEIMNNCCQDQLWDLLRKETKRVDSKVQYILKKLLKYETNTLKNKILEHKISNSSKIEEIVLNDRIHEKKRKRMIYDTNQTNIQSSSPNNPIVQQAEENDPPIKKRRTKGFEIGQSSSETKLDEELEEEEEEPSSVSPQDDSLHSQEEGEEEEEEAAETDEEEVDIEALRIAIEEEKEEKLLGSIDDMTKKSENAVILKAFDDTKQIFDLGIEIDKKNQLNNIGMNIIKIAAKRNSIGISFLFFHSSQNLTNIFQNFQQKHWNILHANITAKNSKI